MSFENLLNLAPEGHIGVFVSGGLDSAFLLYLMLRENKVESPRELTVFCVPKHDGAAHYSQLVVDQVSKMLNIDPPPIRLIGNPDLNHDRIVLEAWQTILANKLADHLFFADNVVPRVVLPGMAPNRAKSPNRKIIQPFLPYTKDYLIESIFEHGAEDLISVTHSCTEQARGRCNSCWQCGERAWAFAKVMRIDPGIE